MATHNSKYKLDPILPVFIVTVGVAVVSFVFGLMFFPMLTGVCANELLQAASTLGYFGSFMVLTGLLLEAYHLYEEHKRHVIVLVVLSGLIAIITVWLMYFLASQYSC